ncbi:MAG: OB-fold nucleic acid binding domain-containing protein [Chloroflexi bacterium]|nr:OB-fold nucleic acid binding domain-containing protein [Chloroflexota bacterium]
MFDIFGGSVAVPVENIEMPDIDLDLKEQLASEKEMLGAYISEHPFSIVAKQLASDVDVVLCGQITEEMAGKNVRTAGQVVSARPSFTKDKRPFITATIEDLQGSIEVMAWSDIYEKTKDLWVEGKILLIEGKVRMRNDRPQLNCFKAQEYEIREKQEKVEKSGPVLVPVQNSKEVIIRIKDSGDPDNDVALLKKVIAILKQYPGADEILFFIDGNNLKFPGLTVQYTDELHHQVGELIGEYAIYIQNKVI